MSRRPRLRTTPITAAADVAMLAASAVTTAAVGHTSATPRTVATSPTTDATRLAPRALENPIPIT
jgi:hypothetical protein